MERIAHCGLAFVKNTGYEVIKLGQRGCGLWGWWKFANIVTEIHYKEHKKGLSLCLAESNSYEFGCSTVPLWFCIADRRRNAVLQVPYAYTIRFLGYFPMNATSWELSKPLSCPLFYDLRKDSSYRLFLLPTRTSDVCPCVHNVINTALQYGSYIGLFPSSSPLIVLE